MRFHQVGIENYPLQVYSGALIFSPSKSLIRQIFHNEEPRDIVLKPHTGEYWGSVVSTFEGHDAAVLSMSSSSGPNGTVVASASVDGTIKVWDATTGECLHTFITPCKPKFQFNLLGHRELESILLSFPEGSSDKLLSASSSTVSIWNVITGQCEGVLEHPSEVSVIALSFYNGTATECVTLSTDWTVTVWDLETRKAIKKMGIRPETAHNITLGRFSFAKFAFSSRRKGRVLVRPRSSGFLGPEVGPPAVWELETGKCLWLPEDKSMIGGTYHLRPLGLNLPGSDIAFSPNGELVATSEKTGRIRVWRVATGQCIHTLAPTRWSLNQSNLPPIFFTPINTPSIGVSFTSTSDQLIWIDWGGPHGLLGVCGVDTGKVLHTLHVAGSSDSALCVLGSSNNIAVADSQMVNVINPFSEGSGMSEGAAVNQHVAISNNERYLAYFTRGDVLRVHDLSVPKLLVEKTISIHSDFMYFNDSRLWIGFDAFEADSFACQHLRGLSEPGPTPRHKYQIVGRWILRDSEKHIWLPSRYLPSGNRHQDVQGSTLVVRWGPSNVYYLRFSNDLGGG